MRSAETESVYLLREIKQKFTLPLAFPAFQEFLSDANVSETDITMINQALELIPLTLHRLMIIYESKNQHLEMINVERSTNILKAAIKDLQKNRDYAQALKESLEPNLSKLTSVLNAVPKAKNQEDKVALNNEISNVFEFILRNQQFFFNCRDIIEEGTLSSIRGLHESMGHGYLYHLGIEEELKKTDPHEVRAKVPAEISEAVTAVKENVAFIKEAVERAYNINKRMVDLAVYLYTFVKLANGK